jgi:nitrous oxidase accessory protein NosD
VGNKVSQEGGYAIEVLGSVGVRIANNALEGNGVALKAVAVETSPTMTVVGNRAAGFTVRGVLLYRADQSTISKNVISQRGGSAVHVMNTRNVTMTGNTIDGLNATLTGLVVDTSSNIVVTKNTFRNFSQRGLLLYAASPMVLDLVTCTGNKFSSTRTMYETELSGGASLGKVVFKSNTAG